jgi:uncharacterized protein
MDDQHLAQFLKGIELFNREEFYDCHDTVEEIWLEESSDQQPFLQGIIQSAVAFHHYQHGKWGAARSMFRLAIEKLHDYPEVHSGVRVKELVRDLKHWKNALDEAIPGTTRTPLSLCYPKISLSAEHTASVFQRESD